jgi:hypothetical protein
MKQQCLVCREVHLLPGDTLDCFRKYLAGRTSENTGWVLWAQSIAFSARLPDWNIGSKVFRAKLLKLDGQRLWCPGCGEDSLTCHGRVLEAAVEYMKGLYDAGVN